MPKQTIVGAYINLVRSDYTAYCYYVHEGRWKPARHLKYVCQKVQQFVERDTGHAYDIMVVQMPPQHGKSMTITETLPSFYHGRSPEKRVIMASYNDETAERFTRRNKEKILLYGKPLFGIEIGAVNRATEYEIANHQGRLISRGIMGGITSNPADLILIDDPIKNRQEADSETIRDRIWDEWQNTIKTRLSAGAKIIVIMTRWHEDDLAGRIIKYENNVEVLNLPCEAEENDPIGRKIGDALFPEIGKGNAWLKEFKCGYQTKEGSRAWLALYQGRPTAVEGNMINRSWWKYYDELPNMIQTIMSVDAAFKDSEKNDFVSIQVWGKRLANMYLIDNDTRHLNFPDTLQAIRKMKKKYPFISMILIEDKANGSALISILQMEMPGIVAINPDGGKISRLNAVSPAIESGNVWLPRSAPWLNNFIEECSAFPNGVHDDQVDSMSQALNRLIYFSADIPVIEPEFAFSDMQNAYERNKNPYAHALYSGDVTDDYLFGGW